MPTYKNHPYYTHQPFFIEVLKNTSGDILECGCGDGSTIMIRDNIEGTNRKLVSLENDLEWMNKYTYLEDNSHSFQYIEADNIDCVETGAKWVEFIIKNNLNAFEVVFIDCNPWLARKAVFEHFKDKAKIIIIHDFDYFPNNNLIGKTLSTETYIQPITNDTHFECKKIECDLTGIISNFKLFYPPYKYFAGATGPPTLICSDLMSKVEFDGLVESIESNLHLYYQ